MPTAMAAVSASGPSTYATPPVNVHRAMFCSRRAGSWSIIDACDRLTNAPLAGKNTIHAISSTTNPWLTDTNPTAAANATPPPTTSSLRYPTSPRIPMTGSTNVENMPGTLSSSPI